MPRSNEGQLVFKRGAATTLTEIFQVLQRSNRLRIRTCLPVTVQLYNATTQRAKVRLDLLTKRNTDDGSKNDPALVIDVPVRFPRTAFGFLSFPIVPNDKGHIIVADRSIDNWMRNGGNADDPKLLHTHSVIDGIFEPGLHPSDKPITGITANDAVVLEGLLIRLGVGATQAAVLGTAFAALYNNLVSAYNGHAHTYTDSIGAGDVATPAQSSAPSTAPGFPAVPEPSMVSPTHLSTKVLIQ